MLQTAGGLSLDGQHWVEIPADDEAYAREPLAERFRAEFLTSLVKLYRQQKLLLSGSLAWIKSEADFERWLAPLRSKPWMAHCEGPPTDCQGASAALKYLSRYVVGTAISDDRILADEGGRVRIRIKNYRRGTVEERSLSGEEFVTRFLFHILPRNLRRTRCAGLYSPHHRRAMLTICRHILAGRTPVLPTARHSLGAAPDEPSDVRVNSFEEPAARPCPRCLMPGLTFAGRFNAFQAAVLMAQIDYFWRRAVTIVLVLPLLASSADASRRSGSRLLPEPIAWMITTLDDALLSDAESMHVQLPEPDI